MPVTYNDDGTTTLVHFYHKPGKSGGTTKRKTIKTQDARAVSKAWAELVESISGGSLTVRFKECVELAVKYNGGAGMSSVYEIIKNVLGNRYVDKKFSHYYNTFISDLTNKNYACNTISNYISCIRRSLNVAWESGLFETMPIRKFEIDRKFRNRIWTPDERLKIYNGFDDNDDDLFWKIYLAEHNPIRKMDISDLKREELIMFDPLGPYIKHYPRKTEDTDPQPCILPEIDDALLARYADIQRRFPDCSYLHPRIVKNKRRGTERWEYAGNYKKAFTSLCDKVGVVNFHFHDLKHVSISNMLKMRKPNGERKYTRESLKNLGIQMSDDSIDVYDETTALDELEMVRGGQVEEAKVKKVV